MIDWYIIRIIFDIILIYSIYSGFQVKVVGEAVQAEAEALSSEAEAEALSSEAEARPRHLSTCPRRGRGEALRCLEAASRPRHRGHIPAQLVTCTGSQVPDCPLYCS